MKHITCIEDLRQLHKRRVPKAFFDYADRGSYTEDTLRANSEDLQQIKFRQRILVDVSKRDLSTTILGEPAAMPVILAPVGLLGMQHGDGEIYACRAAQAAGIPFTQSTMSICSIEDIAENTSQPFWFQLYVMKDRPFIERLIDRAFTLTRLQELQPPEEDARDWFTRTFLPPVLALVRPHRQLVLLLDDIDGLLDRIKQGTYRADTIAYLRAMTDQFSQLHIVATLGLHHEARLSELYPLVLPTHTLRLTSLAPQETAWLLREPIRDLYSLDDEALHEAHELTGGEPAFVQFVGNTLFRRYLSDDKTTFTTDDIKRAGQTLYRQVEGDLRDTWEALNYNEGRVLKGISQLIYANPLRPVDLDAIAAWLADSDDPLDRTTISAALRSLEYREIVALLPDGIHIQSLWMQRFLLENAYNVPLAAPPSGGGTGGSGVLKRRNRGLRVALLFVLVAMLVVGVLLLSALSSLPAEREIIPEAPTMTLFGGG